MLLCFSHDQSLAGQSGKPTMNDGLDECLINPYVAWLISILEVGLIANSMINPIVCWLGRVSLINPTFLACKLVA